MTNKPIRIGFLGIAHLHSTSYVRSLLAMPGVEVAGMYDGNEALAAEWAERFAVPRYAGASDLLAAGLDAVVVCSENALHRPYVEQAAGRVKAILCEKPISTASGCGVPRWASALTAMAMCEYCGTAAAPAMTVAR